MKVRYLLPKLLAAALLVFNCACLAAQDRSTLNEMESKPAHQPPWMGMHWAREFARSARSRKSPNMTCGIL